MSVWVLSAVVQFSARHWVILGVVVVVVYFATSGRKPMRRCTRCQEVNRDQAVFCAQCGTRLSEKR